MPGAPPDHSTTGSATNNDDNLPLSRAVVPPPPPLVTLEPIGPHTRDAASGSSPPGHHPYTSDETALLQPYASSSSLSSSPASIHQGSNSRTHHTVTKLKRVLHLAPKEGEDGDGHEGGVVVVKPRILAESRGEASTSRMDDDDDEEDDDGNDDARAKEPWTAKAFLRHPLETVKAKMSKQGNAQLSASVAVKEIAHGHEVDMIRAYDDVQSTDAATDPRKKAVVEAQLRRLVHERQAKYVRWSMDRHVTKVRVVPSEMAARKDWGEYRRKNARGVLAMDWRAYAGDTLTHLLQSYGGRYIGSGSDPPLPSRTSIRPNIERILIASAPVQELLLSLRGVYMWEHPNQTAGWMGLFLAGWWYDVLLAGMLTALLLLTLRRRFSPASIADVRGLVTDVEDPHRPARNLADFIEKRGVDVWLDQLLEAAGPPLMMTLADTADALEVLRNFYEWTVPARTRNSLIILALSAIVTACTPTWLLVKSATFAAGVFFFAVLPLTTTYPDYRLLASVTRRVFWGVPSHGEWAIETLQAEGARYKADKANEAHLPTAGIAADSARSYDVPLLNVSEGYYAASFSCPTSPGSAGGSNNSNNSNKDDDTDTSLAGRLIIRDNHLCFSTTTTSTTQAEAQDKTILWTIPYPTLQRLEKIDRLATQTASKVHPLKLMKQNLTGTKGKDQGQGRGQEKGQEGTGMDLRIVDLAGRERLLMNVEERDQAFSQILGLSGVDARWQVVW